MATAPLLSGEQPPAYSETADPYIPSTSRAPPAGQVSGTPGYSQPPAGQYPPGSTGPYNDPYNKTYPAGYQSGAPAGMYPQVPPGYHPVQGQPQPSYLPSTTIIHTQPSVVVVGGCPACRVGVLEDDFTCLGVCCAIFFFPLGILCCLAMRQRRCPNCGSVFG